MRRSLDASPYSHLQNILARTIAIAVVVATIGGIAYVLYTNAQIDGAPHPGLRAPVSVVCPGPPDPTTGHSFPGFPAIHPRNDCTPSFTQRDVRAYLAVAGARHGKLWSINGQPTVTRVVFLTIGDLRRAAGYSEWVADYPPDMLVCYAGLSGTFAGGGPEMSATFITGGPDDIFAPFGPPLQGVNTAYIVFDAHTGNELGDDAGTPLG